MKNSQNSIDIILPSYNCEKYIKQTINSIINQSFKRWKLIIIDDASNEKTRKILLKYERNKKIKIIWLRKNKGAGFCRNLAIKKCNSKYIAFIDSDDIWHKHKLKQQVEFMLKNKKKFTYTFYKTFGLKKRIIKTPKKFNFSSFIRNTSIATSTMMIERKIAKNCKFTETEICEDYFFKCSALKKTKSAAALQKYLTNYRIRKNSLQSNKFKNLYWIWKINKKYNNLNFVDNLFSVISISLNSIKKYGFK